MESAGFPRFDLYVSFSNTNLCKHLQKSNRGKEVVKKLRPKFGVLDLGLAFLRGDLSPKSALQRKRIQFVQV